MSLINDMLRDLETRQGLDKANLDEVFPVMPAGDPVDGSNRTYFIATVVCSFLIAGMVGTYFYFNGGFSSIATGEVNYLLSHNPSSAGVTSTDALNEGFDLGSNPSIEMANVIGERLVRANKADALKKELKDFSCIDTEKLNAMINQARVNDFGIATSFPPLDNGGGLYAGLSESNHESNAYQEPSLNVSTTSINSMEEKVLTKVKYYISLGEYDKADIILNNALMTDASNITLRSWKARIKWQKKGFYEVIKLLNFPELPADEKAVEAMTLLALSYQQVGDHENAQRTYEKMLRINMKHGPWYLGLGVSLENQDKKTKAIWAYEQALKSKQLSQESTRFSKERLGQLLAK